MVGFCSSVDYGCACVDLQSWWFSFTGFVFFCLLGLEIIGELIFVRKVLYLGLFDLFCIC